MENSRKFNFKNLFKIIIGCFCCCILVIISSGVIIIYFLAGAIQKAPDIDVRNLNIFDLDKNKLDNASDSEPVLIPTQNEVPPPTANN